MALTEHALLSPHYLDEVARLVREDPAVTGTPHAERDTDADGVAELESLHRGCQVRIAGEWHWVWAVDRDNRRLLVEEALDPTSAMPTWWYQATDGERFTCAEPF